jgi:hypothetical protein
MTFKIERERGKKKRVGGGLTLIRIILRHHKNFRGAGTKRERNDMNMARSDAATILP